LKIIFKNSKLTESFLFLQRGYLR